MPDQARERRQTLVEQRVEDAPLSEGGLTRNGGGNELGDELDLFDVSLRTSERGRIIFAVDWSSVTDYCSIVKLLFQDRREETTLFNPSTSYAMEKKRRPLYYNYPKFIWKKKKRPDIFSSLLFKGKRYTIFLLKKKKKSFFSRFTMFSHLMWVYKNMLNKNPQSNLPFLQYYYDSSRNLINKVI